MEDGLLSAEGPGSSSRPDRPLSLVTSIEHSVNRDRLGTVLTLGMRATSFPMSERTSFASRIVLSIATYLFVTSQNAGALTGLPSALV
jgi:hypothetical protein